MRVIARRPEAKTITCEDVAAPLSRSVVFTPGSGLQHLFNRLLMYPNYHEYKQFRFPLVGRSSVTFKRLARRIGSRGANFFNGDEYIATPISTRLKKAALGYRRVLNRVSVAWSILELRSHMKTKASRK